MSPTKNGKAVPDYWSQTTVFNPRGSKSRDEPSTSNGKAGEDSVKPGSDNGFGASLPSAGPSKSPALIHRQQRRVIRRRSTCVDYGQTRKSAFPAETSGISPGVGGTFIFRPSKYDQPTQTSSQSPGVFFNPSSLFSKPPSETETSEKSHTDYNTELLKDPRIRGPSIFDISPDRLSPELDTPTDSQPKTAECTTNPPTDPVLGRPLLSNDHEIQRSPIFDLNAPGSLPPESDTPTVSLPTPRTTVDPTTDPVELPLDDSERSQSDHNLSNEPRGILKKRHPRFEATEKRVLECLELLCRTHSDEKDNRKRTIRQSVSEVFGNVCPDQFFTTGECYSSTCEEKHHYVSRTFSNSDEQMWYASLHVICYAAQPSLQIVENLIQHYSAKGNPIKILAFAKCIPRLRARDRLELANYMINMMESGSPRRDVITAILMLNFPDLPAAEFVVLMKGLGVFSHDTTQYGELMGFLNFREFLMPTALLKKLIEDAMDHSESRSELVGTIAGFLGRLPSRQMNEIQSTAENFSKRFEIQLDSNPIQIEKECQKVLKKPKKRIQFVDEPEVRFLDAMTAEVPEVDVPEDDGQEEGGDDETDGEFSDDEGGRSMQVDFPNEDINRSSSTRVNFYKPLNYSDEVVLRVFKETCTSWMLNGECKDPICCLAHIFSKDVLVGLSSEDAFSAADFVLTQSTTPSIELLQIFIDFLAESDNPLHILKFRKCSPKLNYEDNVKLTDLVISRLSNAVGRWGAIELMLLPDYLQSNDAQFLFTNSLIHQVMNGYYTVKDSILKDLAFAILDRAFKIPPPLNPELLEMIAKFTDKFVIAGRVMPQLPDILPVNDIQPKECGGLLKVALYLGGASKYFMATALLKHAVNNRTFKHEALDILYTYMLANYNRASVFSDLVENCRYLDVNTQAFVREVFGAVGLSSSLRLFEDENHEGAAELLLVLIKFRYDIFRLVESHGKLSELSVAIMYCKVVVDTDQKRNAIQVFLKHCLGPYLKSATCPPEVVKAADKMFSVFTRAANVDGALELCRAIVALQKSIQTPLNISQYVEPILRYCFHRGSDENVRRDAMKLYFDIVSSGSVKLHKLTHKSMLLILLLQLKSDFMKAKTGGHPNYIHPLVKVILLKCIEEKIYHPFDPSQIMLSSTMTSEEIQVYIFWWFCLYIRAKIRQSASYENIPLVKIVISVEFIQDDPKLPTAHRKFATPDFSLYACANRLASALRHSLNVPLPRFVTRGRSVIELPPLVVHSLVRKAIQIMRQYDAIVYNKKCNCRVCFDNYTLGVDL